MAVADLRYPVISFSDQVFEVLPSAKELTTIPSRTLRSGWFNQMLIVDSTNKAHRVKAARKLHNAGYTWIGPFPVRLVKVDLEFDGEPFLVSIAEIKQHVYNATIAWHGLQSQGDFEELQERIQKAETITELIEVLA